MIIETHKGLTMTERLRFLSIIRGLAALSVVFSHIDTSYLSQIGILHYVIYCAHCVFIRTIWINEGIHPGVIVFIVLSGFCIHLPQARKQHLNLNIRDFSHKRFFRIYPVFIVALSLGILINTLLNLDKTNPVENIIINLLCVTALIPLKPPIGNPILLTVIVECILYCLYPLGLKLIKLSSWKWLFFSCFSLYALNIFWLLFSNTDHTWIQRNIWALLSYWWIGALAVELCYGRFKHVSIKKIHFLFIYLSYFIFCLTLHFKGIHLIKSLLFAMNVGFILMFLFQKEHTIKSKSNKSNAFFTRIKIVFTTIGEMSYSLYVVHIPILTMLHFYFFNFFQKTFFYKEIFYCANILIVTIGTILLYYFIEKPSHKYAQKFKNNNHSKWNEPTRLNSTKC